MAGRGKIKYSTTLVFVGVILIGIQLVLLLVGLSLKPQHALSSPLMTELDRSSPGVISSNQNRKPDGTFNGYPIYYHEQSSALYSVVQCVGENYQGEASWMHRSCHFSFLCLDVKENEFKIFQQPREEATRKYLVKRPFMDVSQTYIQPLHNTSVSLGGINLKWGSKTDTSRLKWFPQIATDYPTSFYTLPPDVVLIPFHSLAGGNPGHLVWDDFLSMFTLLSMFQLEDFKALPLRYVLPGPRGLWASCDWTSEKKNDCRKMINKFWPLMTQNDKSVLTTQDAPQLSVDNQKSNLVCAKNGLAGIGALTDHGTNKYHGWIEDDYKTTQNHGRGGLLFKFRTFAMSNMGLADLHRSTSPYHIVFSESSTQSTNRDLDFREQKSVLKQYLNTTEADVKSYVFKEYSLKEQLEIAGKATIFVTGCGGGAVTAMFLPRGSTVIVYYNEVGGRMQNKPLNTPARLDWDLFNNLGYLRVHWVPSGTMNTNEDTAALVELVKHELDVVRKDF